MSSDRPAPSVDRISADASAGLALEVYGPSAQPTGFQVLEAEWDKLLAQSRFHDFFLTYAWQTTWWENLGEGELWILAFRRPGTGELIGIVPLYLIQYEQNGRQIRQLNLVGCIEVSDYLDIIAVEGAEHEVLQGLLRWLESPDAPVWDQLDLCNLPEASVTYTEAPPIFEAAGYAVERFQEDTAPQFALPLHYETYLSEQVEKRHRHEIRRKQRRAEREAEIGFHLVDERDSLEVEIDDFIALQRASREDKADFMTPAMHNFFLVVARRMQAAGRLRLFFLTINGEKAAALFAFEFDRRLWLYNSGYDPEAHAQLSPGWVLLAYVIQYAIAGGCRVFDFMQGNEEYKYRFGSHDYKVMRVIVRKPAA
jgi:CelD/BcsL family acetyltransferase involved in cellulose biosynthesis